MSTTIAKGGPYIGPRGGKWADTAHTIPWHAEGDDAVGGYAPVSRDKAVSTIIAGIPKNMLAGWLRNADRSYKDGIAEAIDDDPHLRNATLNLMHQQYQIGTGSKISFGDFLDTPIKLYRAGKTPTTEAFSSYTYDPKIAAKFGEAYGTEVHTISVKPRDTYGMINEMAEGEVLVPVPSEHTGKFTAGATIQVRGKDWHIVKRAGRQVYMRRADRPESKPMKMTEQRLAEHMAKSQGAPMRTEITMGPNLPGRQYVGTVNYMGILLGVEHKPGAVNPFSKKKTQAGYGEIPGTRNIDGDPVDFLLGPDLDSDLVFVLQQTIPNTQGDPHVGDIRANGGDGQYDEDKLVFGCWTEREAVALYHDYYGGSGRTVVCGPTMDVAYLREHVLFCPSRDGMPVFKSLSVPAARDGWPRLSLAQMHPGIFGQLDAIVALSDGDPQAAARAALNCWAGLQKSDDGGDKAPAGFEPIPTGKKGGYRKRKPGGGYDYWYPGQHEVHHHPDWEPDPTAGTGVEDLKDGAFVFVLGLGTALFRYHPEHAASEDGMTWVQNQETGKHEAVRESNVQRARGFDPDERDRKERGRRPGGKRPGPRPPRPGGRKGGKKKNQGAGGRKPRPPGDNRGKRKPLPPPDYDTISPNAPRVPVYEGDDGAEPGTTAWALENGVYLMGEFTDGNGLKQLGAYVPDNHQNAFVAEFAGLMGEVTRNVAQKLGIKVNDSQGLTPAYEEVFSGARLGLIRSLRSYQGNIPFTAQAVSYMTTYARQAASDELGRGVPMPQRFHKLLEGFMAARARAWADGNESDVATIAREWHVTKKQVTRVDWGRYQTVNRKGEPVVKDQGAMQVPMGPWSVLDPTGQPVGDKAYPGKVALAEDMLTYISGDRMDDASWLDMEDHGKILPDGAGADLPIGTALYYRKEVDTVLATMDPQHRAVLVLAWALDGQDDNRDQANDPERRGGMALHEIASALNLPPERKRGKPDAERTPAELKRALRARGKRALDNAKTAFKRAAQEMESPVANMAEGWSYRPPEREPLKVIDGPSQRELVEEFGGGDDGSERHRIYLAGVGMGVGAEFREALKKEATTGLPEAQSRAIREAYHEYRDAERLKAFQRQTAHWSPDPSDVHDIRGQQDADEVLRGYMQVVAKRGLPQPGDGGLPKRAGAGRSKVWSDERLDRFLGRRRPEPKGDNPDGQSSEDDNG